MIKSHLTKDCPDKNSSERITTGPNHVVYTWIVTNETLANLFRYERTVIDYVVAALCESNDLTKLTQCCVIRTRTISAHRRDGCQIYFAFSHSFVTFPKARQFSSVV